MNKVKKFESFNSGEKVNEDLAITAVLSALVGPALISAAGYILAKLLKDSAIKDHARKLGKEPKELTVEEIKTAVSKTGDVAHRLGQGG